MTLINNNSALVKWRLSCPWGRHQINSHLQALLAYKCGCLNFSWQKGGSLRSARLTPTDSAVKIRKRCCEEKAKPFKILQASSSHKHTPLARNPTFFSPRLLHLKTLGDTKHINMRWMWSQASLTTGEVELINELLDDKRSRKNAFLWQISIL